jgi:hypothetical protein
MRKLIIFLFLLTTLIGAFVYLQRRERSTALQEVTISQNTTPSEELMKQIK